MAAATRKLLVLFPLAALGCGDSLITGATVCGTVKQENGEPVTGGAIRLISLHDPAKSMQGRIKGDGTYCVPNAPLGHVKVLIDTEAAKLDPSVMVNLAPPTARIDRSQLGPPTRYVPLDPKFRDPRKTPLRMTVHQGEQTHDVVIPPG